MVGVRAFRTVDTGFDRYEYAGIHRRLNSLGEIDESRKIVLCPHGVELMPGGRLGFCEEVEAEDRNFAMDLLIGEAERCCL